MTIEEWAAIGQVAGAIFTLLGVLVSLYMSIKALREVQKDRELGQTPYLAFVLGGAVFPIQFNKIVKSNSKQDRDLPVNAETIGLKTNNGEIIFMYGELRNYGLGPAIGTRIIWVAHKVWIGSEEFKIDNKKLSEEKYSRQFNTIPASPNHILPNQHATFFRLPSFISMDYEKKITKVEGIVEIRCFDIFKQQHLIRQEFFIFTEYTSDTPNIHITFSDLELEIFDK